MLVMMLILDADLTDWDLDLDLDLDWSRVWIVRSELISDAGWDERIRMMTDWWRSQSNSYSNLGRV
jgi:hypothetical protein